jgi:hypothetical protein
LARVDRESLETPLGTLYAVEFHKKVI